MSHPRKLQPVLEPLDEDETPTVLHEDQDEIIASSHEAVLDEGLVEIDDWSPVPSGREKKPQP